MLPLAASLAKFCDVFCEPRVFSIEDARQVMEAAKSHGMGLRMHVDQLENGGGARLAAQVGAATADHLEFTDAAGVQALKDTGVQPVLLPGAVYALGSRKYPDARAMIAAGLGVVLATDFNPGSSPTPSMPMILSLAATQMKMTIAEGITASTINAAYSLGLGAETGSLEVGKSADFVIHDCQDHRELGYFFGVEPAREVYIRGERVFSRYAA
jgi:imidazolonepropionase